MFQLTPAEFANLNHNLRFQVGAGRAARHNIHSPSRAWRCFSSVLRSPRAVQVNIAIMRAFVKLRGLLASHRDLARRLDKIESKYDAQFKVVFDAIRRLMTPPEKPRHRTGFAAPDGR